jgi:hypothetical protein
MSSPTPSLGVRHHTDELRRSVLDLVTTLALQPPSGAAVGRDSAVAQVIRKMHPKYASFSDALEADQPKQDLDADWRENATKLARHSLERFSSRLEQALPEQSCSASGVRPATPEASVPGPETALALRRLWCARYFKSRRADVAKPRLGSKEGKRRRNRFSWKMATGKARLELRCEGVFRASLDFTGARVDRVGVQSDATSSSGGPAFARLEAAARTRLRGLLARPELSNDAVAAGLVDFLGEHKLLFAQHMRLGLDPHGKLGVFPEFL